jgi:hypothetical protein
MKSKKILLALCVWMFIPVTLFANDDEPDVRDLPIRERIILGGNLGLQIGNISTVVIVSPA